MVGIILISLSLLTDPEQSRVLLTGDPPPSLSGLAPDGRQIVFISDRTGT
jgi:Tol biopolymer transport system component